MHLDAGTTASPVLAQTARSELAQPLVNASVERFSHAKHVFTRKLLQSSILHRLFGCIEASLEAPLMVYRAIVEMPVGKRMQMLNKRVRALRFFQRGVSAIFARCIRTPLSRRVYEVEHGCQDAGRVPGFYTWLLLLCDLTAFITSHRSGNCPCVNREREW